MCRGLQKITLKSLFTLHIFMFNVHQGRIQRTSAGDGGRIKKIVDGGREIKKIINILPPKVEANSKNCRRGGWKF